MKKLAFLMAVMMMFTLLLAGCNGTTTSSAPQESSKPAENSGDAPSTDDPYAGIDLSKEETIVMYACADEPNAMAEVLAAANEKIKDAINTTIDLYFI